MNLPFLPYNLSRHPDRKHVQLLVAPDARTGEYWYENLKYWLGDPASLYWFSDWETLPYDQYTPHPDLVAERLRVLAELPTRTHGIVIASAAALRQRLCPQTHLDKYGIHLAVGDRLARDALIQRLIDAGYQRNAHHISGKGEYAARGNIVDLYPMNAADPIRLEWFDDSIDSIRTFAVADQRTLEKRDSISILPRSELDLSDAGRTCYRQNARLHYGEKIVDSPLYRQISDGQTPQGLEYYLPLFYDDTATLFDYLPQEVGVVIHRKPIDTELLGKRFFLAHGDEVGYQPFTYRVIQRIFRNRLCQILYAAIHPRWTFGFARRWSLSSRKSGLAAERLAAAQARNIQSLETFVKEYLPTHPDTRFFLFGHLHLMVDKAITDHTRLMILGDWMQFYSYAVWDGQLLELKQY